MPTLAVIVTLCDHLSKLMGMQTDKDASLFKNVIEQTQAAFVKVHSEYIASFKNYRILLENSEYPMTKEHPVFRALENDIPETRAGRDDLWVAIETTHNKRVEQYTLCLQRYLNHSIGEISGGWSPFRPRESNLARYRLSQELSYIMEPYEGDTPDEMRAKALKELRRVLNELQDSHREVITAYSKTKKNLLRLKG